MKVINLQQAKSAGDRLTALGSVCALVTLLIYSGYGAMYRYFDVVVFVFLLAAAVLGGAAVRFSGINRMAGLLKLVAVMLLSGALALFFYNSFPVWADELNNITMYNSRGGLAPVILLCILFLLCIISMTVSCFMKDGGEGI